MRARFCCRQRPAIGAFKLVQFGFIRSRTNSLYPAFLLHAGFNGIALVAGVLN